jgi:predicted CopG family antitoxin
MVGRVIRVSDKTYAELCKLGKFGEDTWDNVIIRLLSMVRR